MASSQKSAKNRSKHLKSRPPSTAIISQPIIQDKTMLDPLSSFSLNGQMFAFLSLAVDKHRLRVYNTSSGQPIAEYVADTVRVTSLSWATLNLHADTKHSSPDDGTASPTKKKRKKRSNMDAGEQERHLETEIVVLGLSDGSISLFCPARGQVLRTLSHPSSSSAILAATPSEGNNSSTLWASSADGAIRIWDVQKNDILDGWRTNNRIPYTCMVMRPSDEGDRTYLLAAHHSIRLFSKKMHSTNPSNKNPNELASFTGHTSSVTLARWIGSQTPPRRFVTMAECDRFLYIWRLDDGEGSEGSAAASISLDSDARTFALATSPSSSNAGILATLSVTGRISIYPIPEELNSPANSNRTAHKIPTLLPRSNIVTTSKSNIPGCPVIDLTFPSGGAQSICVARLANGIRPVFDTIKIVDETGNYIPDLALEDVDLSAIKERNIGLQAQRYTEASVTVVGLGTGLGLNEQDDDIPNRDVDGDLEVDLAEASLGQRMTVVNGEPLRGSDSDNDEPDGRRQGKAKKKTQKDVVAVPANSLTRTLIQALHSSDTRLLETCLAHSEPTLIWNTIRRLPPQLAIPLVTACAERLGRGARATNMKGGGGGASSQRGTGLITWIKAVLAVHTGHLMTMPDLVARLSGLYSTITTRLVLHENLLALNGKLDMVLSQIEMRSSVAPAPLAPRKGKARTASAQIPEVKRYVEGESESSEVEDPVEVEVEVESDDDNGSIEDVEFGGESEDGEDSDNEDMNSGTDEEDSDDRSESPTLNGFIDDEAEEWSEEEDEDDSE